MAQSNATIYIKPNTLTSLSVVAITDEGTLNLSLSDFVQSSIPSGVYLAYTASDFNRITSVTVSSPGYKTATWSTTGTQLTDVYVTLEEAPNPVIREISVGGVVYDIATKGGSGSGRNIGDIFYTTRTDTALAGAVECNGGTYDTRDYTGAGSIGELLAGGKLPYVSLAEYATLLSTNGVVGVFGWDSTGTTTFRVPTLQDVFIECGQASQLGNYISAGLPNITGTGAGNERDVGGDTGKYSGAFRVTKTGIAGGYAGAGYSRYEYNFYASRSSSIYGNSDTVQPKAIKYRAMVQLFNGTTDEAVATVGGVLADVAGLKTDTAGIIDYVIEESRKTSAVEYTWYRKYKSGWVEQGGRTKTNGVISSTNQRITLPIEMAYANYFVGVLENANSGNTTMSVGWESTTGFSLGSQTGGTTGRVNWIVKGWAK